MVGETISLLHLIFFAALLLAVIGFFPAVDALADWNESRRRRAEYKTQREHERRYWKRKFIWSVFSTKRVPRLTDRRDAG